MTALLEFFQQGSFIWKLSQVLLIPLLVILLGELSERLERQGNPLAQGVRTIRHVVLPILAVVLLMRYIFDIADSKTSFRMVETAFWVSVIVASLMLLSNVFRLTEVKPASLWAAVPRFFFTIARTGVIRTPTFLAFEGGVRSFRRWTVKERSIRSRAWGPEIFSGR